MSCGTSSCGQVPVSRLRGIRTGPGRGEPSRTIRLPGDHASARAQPIAGYCQPHSQRTGMRGRQHRTMQLAGSADRRPTTSPPAYPLHRTTPPCQEDRDVAAARAPADLPPSCKPLDHRRSRQLRRVRPFPTWTWWLLLSFCSISSSGRSSSWLYGVEFMSPRPPRSARRPMATGRRLHGRSWLWMFEPDECRDGPLPRPSRGCASQADVSGDGWTVPKRSASSLSTENT